MTRAGRWMCVAAPMALTVAALICLILVGLGGTNQHNSTYRDLYFFRADTTAAHLPDSTANQVFGAAKSLLQDFYLVSLWNYCSGNGDSVQFCSPHTNGFYFDPVAVWHLDNTDIENLFPSELRQGLATYQRASKWMFVAYLVALILTIVEIFVGFLALFSRLGSCLTTTVSLVASLSAIVFALTATILYAVLTGTFNAALTKYGIHGSLGRSMYTTVWLAVLFSCLAGFFWLVSSCCCAARKDRDIPTRWGWANTYHRMADPPMDVGQGQHDYHMSRPHHQHHSTAYEPYRTNGRISK